MTVRKLVGAPQEHEGGEGFVEAVFDDVRDSSLGVEFQARGDGVAVSEVVPGSRASRVAGLHAGMVLIGVYGKDGRGRSTRGLDYSHVMELIKNTKACDHVKLRFAASSEARPAEEYFARRMRDVLRRDAFVQVPDVYLLPTIPRPGLPVPAPDEAARVAALRAELGLLGRRDLKQRALDAGGTQGEIETRDAGRDAGFRLAKDEDDLYAEDDRYAEDILDMYDRIAAAEESELGQAEAESKIQFIVMSQAIDDVKFIRKRQATGVTGVPESTTAGLHCTTLTAEQLRANCNWSCCSAQIVPPAPTAEQLRANLELLKAEAKQLQKFVSAAKKHAKKAEAQLVGEPLIVLHMPCYARPLSHHTQIVKRGSF